MRLVTTAHLTLLFWLGAPLNAVLLAYGNQALNTVTRPSIEPAVKMPSQEPSSPDALLPRYVARRDRGQTASAAYDGPPPMTRQQILDIARSAVGSRYMAGGESWDPLDRSWGGPDCTGLLVKAWQLSQASESWEELLARPTADSFQHWSSVWSERRMQEREPGDILVSIDEEVRQVLVFEKDDSDFARNEQVWVYEAAAPRVRRKSYSIQQLRGFTLYGRKGIDDVGLVGRSRSWIFGPMIDAFIAAGGEAKVGRPFDRSDGILVRRIETARRAGYAQDFEHGTLGRAMIILPEGMRNAFVVSEPLFAAYWDNGGPDGKLGFPIGPASPSAIPGCMRAVRQSFEHGYLSRGCNGTPRAHLGANPHTRSDRVR
jgi:hypothetical protein